MDKVIKVFVEDNDYLIERMVRDEFGWQVQDAFDPDNIDVLVFSGGADVSPHLYLEHNVDSWCDLERDLACLSMFTKFKGPKIGICRGGQFLNVASGGRMWQDVDNHGSSHMVRDLETSKEYFCTSTHHQMMRPGPNAQVVAIAAPGRSTYRVAANEVEKFPAQDIEVLFYESTNSLCFQPHPEYEEHPECILYFGELVQRFFPDLM